MYYDPLLFEYQTKPFRIVILENGIHFVFHDLCRIPGFRAMTGAHVTAQPVYYRICILPVRLGPAFCIEKPWMMFSAICGIILNMQPGNILSAAGFPKRFILLCMNARTVRNLFRVRRGIKRKRSQRQPGKPVIAQPT